MTTTDAAGRHPPTRITYSEAVREAIGQAMEADDRVFMLGEDIGIYGGAFGVSGDLYRFGGADPRHPDLRARHRRRRRRRRRGGMRRSWRSSSRTSRTRRWTRSSTRPRRSTSCSGARPPCRWCCAPDRLGTGAAAQHCRASRRGSPTSRPQGGHAGHRRGRQGPAARGDRRPQPRHRPGAQAALPHLGSGARGGRPHPARQDRRAPHRERPVDRRHRRDGLPLAGGRRHPRRRGHRRLRHRPRTLTPLDDAPILADVSRTGRALLVQEAPATSATPPRSPARITESPTLYRLLAPSSGSTASTPRSPTPPSSRRPPSRRSPTSSTPPSR